MRMVTPGPDTFPQSLPVVKTYDRMQQAFPGTALPATVVVKAPNVNAPAVRAAIARLEQRALASGRMHGPITVDVNDDATVANITVPIDGTGTDGASNAALSRAARRDRARDGRRAPGRRGRRHRARPPSGRTATDELRSNLPPVVAFVLVFAFALMLVAFRSIVVAVKAIVLNLLSVAAAYGVLVLVFQHGFGKGLLGFGSDGRDRPGGAAAAVRDPVRPLDGLPRLRPRAGSASCSTAARPWTRRSRRASSRRPASSRARPSSWSRSSRSSRRSRC